MCEENDQHPEDELDVEVCKKSHDDDRIALGRKGEDAAVRYLERNDFNILERNWTCAYGEADIIAEDIDGTICFVEVKTRRSIEAGIPEEAIDERKRRRYEKIALCYMTEQECLNEAPLRFDAIGICVSDGSRALLRHHRGFFDGRF